MGIIGMTEELPAQGDSSVCFRNPLDLPVSLSASYGELRANHFHSGVDFRVGGVIGAPVYSAEDGYVSRISVSPSGYGNALYISHKGGYMSVYGHMHEFAPEIRRYVENVQYEKESFGVNIYPSPDELPVTKGMYIGKAGNTGSSAGPHLHFEIRDRDGNRPLNIISRGMVSGVIDRTPPVFRYVGFYHYDRNELESVRVCGYAGVYGGVVELPEEFYVAVDAVDRQERTNAKLAVVRYEVYFDGKLCFAYNVGENEFSETKYINSVIEYAEKQNTGRTMVKTMLEPGNMLADRYEVVENGGIFRLDDDGIHTLRLRICDEHGNDAERIFKVRKGGSSCVSETGLQDSAAFDGYRTASGRQLIFRSVYMMWSLPNVFLSDSMKLYMPPGALYNSINFRASIISRDSLENKPSCKCRFYSSIYKVHDRNVALHKPAMLSIKPAGIPDSLRKHAVIARVMPSGTVYSSGGKWNGEFLEAQISSFGKYSVVLDTVPPSAVPDFTDNADLRKRKSLSFRIRDDLSGIANFRVEVDGKWVLVVYDSKNSRLTLPFESSRMEMGKKHQLILYLTDVAGNRYVLKRKFYK